MKKFLVLASAVGLAMLSGAPAQADDSSLPWNDEVEQWFVAPFIGYAWLDSDRYLDDDAFWGASIGKHLTDDWSAQITAYTGDYDNSGEKDPSWNWPASFDGSLSGVSIDLMRVFSRSNKISPYVLGGLGYQSNNYVGLEGDANVTTALGLGLMWDLYRNGDGSRTVQLRPEIRQRWELATGDTYGDMLVQVGLGFGWGPPRPAPVVAEAPPPPPPPAKCSDSDGDGVCDADDKCPGTPAGDRVGPFGCSCDVVIRTNFAFDSAVLTAEDKATLDKAAARLKELEFVEGTATGHTDNIGTAEYNQKLSERRAQAVVDYLAAQGVYPGRIKAIGMGLTKPIADNSTEEGRAQNRRVTIRRTDCGPAE